MSCPVEFVKTEYIDNIGKCPAGMLNDIFLYFTHYSSEKTLYEFENIPYKNKLIFTPLDIDTPSSYHLNLDDSLGFGGLANETSRGNKNILDIIAFCNHEDNYIRVN